MTKGAFPGALRVYYRMLPPIGKSKRITNAEMYGVIAVKPLGGAKPALPFFFSGVMDAETGVYANKDKP